LEHPWRLVLDFNRIAFGFDPQPDQWTGLVNDLRWGDMSDINSRIIFEMENPFRIEKITNVENSETNTHRIIIDLALSDADTFKESLIDRMRTSAVVNREAKSGRLGVGGLAPQRGGQFRIVLDPGHGGIDTGAVGRRKTIEKAITLAFAKQLKAELETRPGLDVILTRDTDVFIPLNDRVQFARQHNADLFISIHADSVREKHVRGATVYTISEKASDSVAARIAESENKSDAIAGLTFADEPEDVSDILIDLARRETLGFSVQFARLAVDSISQEVRMIKNSHRHAGFRVLRAPDVPSVLLELGFLSNLEDEKLLNQPEWRAKVARTISNAVAQFAALSGREIAEKRESR
jgi:N-acetylmuramoyl-L-alanine amidase